MALEAPTLELLDEPSTEQIVRGLEEDNFFEILGLIEPNDSNVPVAKRELALFTMECYPYLYTCAIPCLTQKNLGIESFIKGVLG